MAENQRHPWHESVVSFINTASPMEMNFLARQLKATSVPKGHDEISNAWVSRQAELGWKGDDLGVPAEMTEQKSIADEKAKAKAQQSLSVMG